MMETVSSWSSPSTDATSSSTSSNFYRPSGRIYSPIKDGVRDYSPLRETPREYFECLEDSECHDELFLLPEQVLDMDSYVVREDLSAIVPSFRQDQQMIEFFFSPIVNHLVNQPQSWLQLIVGDGAGECNAIFNY